MPAPSRPTRRRPRPPKPGHLTLILSVLLLLVIVRGGCTRRGARVGRLSGLVVVLDPGHGGSDPGAAHGGLVESELTYRMASILRRQLEAAGARVVLTVQSAALDLPVAEGAEPPLRSVGDARFAADQTPVTASAIYRRASTARTAWETRGSGERVVFLSLHFDARPGTLSRGGLVCYDDRDGAPPALASRLVDGLRRYGLSGDESQLLTPRELAVLNPQYNPVPERVLVELATLTSRADRAAVKRSAWRWRTARMLVSALSPAVRP